MTQTAPEHSSKNPRDAFDEEALRPGQPVGHFVVVSGWDPQSRTVTIQDPLRKNPLSESGTYKLPFTKFSNAVMLGILTYDENLLVIQAKAKAK